MEWKYFLWFWGLGMLSVVTVQTSFVPDEYWQSLEPAHNLIFGYGKLTWEWRYGIRSYAYPCIIAFIYKILAILHLDYVNALIYAPRILQATISAIGHYYTCELATKVGPKVYAKDVIDGKDVMYWTAAALSTNWFIFYCMSRTLYNTIETVFVVIAMKYCGWNYGIGGDHLRFVIFAAIGCIIRPSAAIIFFPISLVQYVVMYLLNLPDGTQLSLAAQRLMHARAALWRYRSLRYIKLHLYGFLIALVFQIVIDYFCYETFWITPWEFLKFNIVLDLNEHYGTSPYYWYILIGLPTVLFSHLGVLVVAVRNWMTHRAIVLLCTWTLLCYSWSAHKEIRFLLPIIPLLCIIIGIHLKEMEYAHKTCKKNWNPTWIVRLLFITNLPMAFILGFWHQRGTLDAMQFLAEDKTPDNLMNVTFLMPCHSTPAYRNISLQFLSCEPNLHNIPDYVDEADMFYNDPYKWISGRDLSASTHIVIYDTLKDTIWYFLQNFKLCARIFHTNYPSDPRIGKYVEIYCK